ncbi:hypothetical protein ACIRQY_20930 [Streptomyces sp. NPDC101490]|uniref:hypothetical protein n=1 Tax=Streptomyces sp. NPDC101490 TaxID=3366143 RepID=UPI0037FEE2CB
MAVLVLVLVAVRVRVAEAIGPPPSLVGRRPLPPPVASVRRSRGGEDEDVVG